MEQLEFDFPRSRKLWTLRNLTGKFPKPKQQRMRGVLRAIDEIARNDMSCQATHRMISEISDLSVMTVRRGIEDLESFGLLITQEVVSEKGQKGHIYRPVWPSLHAIAEGEETLKSEESTMEKQSTEQSAPCSPRTPPPVHQEQPPCSPRTPPPVHGEHPPLFTVNTPTIYPVCKTDLLPPPPTADEWAEVVGQLMELNLASIKPAISEAQQSGAFPSDIQALIDHYQTRTEITDKRVTVRAWGPGALQKRIANWLPGGDASAGWPEKLNKEYTNWMERKQYIVQQREKASQKASKKKSSKSIANDLEKRHGANLDAYTDDELIRAIKSGSQLWPLLSKQVQNGDDWRKKNRFSLLKLMENGVLPIPEKAGVLFK